MFQTQLISSKGYPFEDYTAQTKDGYLLSVQRIPHGRKSYAYSKNKGQKKPVVFLQHGLLSSANDWVINFPAQSLGNASFLSFSQFFSLSFCYKFNLMHCSTSY